MSGESTSIEAYRSALVEWAHKNESMQFYRPSTLRFKRLQVQAGQYCFTLYWKKAKILEGLIPHTDDLRNKSRVWYVCTLVQDALERIDLERFKPIA
jgi:hypothetical protein